MTDSTPLRILLIDDNKYGLDARRVLLEDLGYQIDTACCGSEGLKKVEVETFDLVVTDYCMPDLQGNEVIKRIRRVDTKLPIVMLSGYVEKLGLTKDDLGADVVLSKGPNEDRDLARTIGRLVKRKPAKKPPQSDVPVTRTRRRSSRGATS